MSLIDATTKDINRSTQLPSRYNRDVLASTSKVAYQMGLFTRKSVFVFIQVSLHSVYSATEISLNIETLHVVSLVTIRSN